MKINLTTTILAGVLATALSMTLQAQTASAVAGAIERGQAKFDHSCAPCHGRGPGDDGRDMLPGTYALMLKYDGTPIPPALEDRADLNSAVISTYVRMGTFSMPPFRKTELSDQEIEDIAAYLAETSKGYAATAQQ